jgi:hypothetical protein
VLAGAVKADSALQHELLGEPRVGRARLAARDRDIDRGRNRVDELVAGERRLQAKRRAWSTFGDLAQVEVSGRRVGPPVDAAA